MTDTDSPSPSPRFRVRPFASFGALLSFFAATVAGIVLFFRPEGTLASWTRWTVFGLDKKGWEGVHTCFVAVFVVFALLHAIINWPVLVGYFRRSAMRPTRAISELSAAVLVVSLLVVATVLRWQPLWSLMDLRNSIKQGSLAVTVQPPIANAEGLPLEELCRLASVPVEDALARLERAGHGTRDRRMTLALLAKETGRSPEALYRVITEP
jgi:HAMP domain-containing protein